MPQLHWSESDGGSDVAWNALLVILSKEQKIRVMSENTAQVL